jgi:hypothetical protein
MAEPDRPHNPSRFAVTSVSSSSAKGADNQEQHGHHGQNDDVDVVVMAEHQRQGDDQDDRYQEFRCVADEEVPPEQTKGPNAPR